jgi:hypothetical protein
MCVGFTTRSNLVPRACDHWEGTRGSGIIRCRKPGILAKIELRIPFQRPIRFFPETDYPRASRSFPRIAGSGNEIGRAALKGSPFFHPRVSFSRVSLRRERPWPSASCPGKAG